MDDFGFTYCDNHNCKSKVRCRRFQEMQRQRAKHVGVVRYFWLIKHESKMTRCDMFLKEDA